VLPAGYHSCHHALSQEAERRAAAASNCLPGCAAVPRIYGTASFLSLARVLSAIDGISVAASCWRFGAEQIFTSKRTQDVRRRLAGHAFKPCCHLSAALEEAGVWRCSLHSAFFTLRAAGAGLSITCWVKKWRVAAAAATTTRTVHTLWRGCANRAGWNVLRWARALPAAGITSQAPTPCLPARRLFRGGRAQPPPACTSAAGET